VAPVSPHERQEPLAGQPSGPHSGAGLSLAGQILITGFDAFGEHQSLNPSALVVQTLDGQVLAGRTVAAHCLPTQFGVARAQLLDLLNGPLPALVLCLGQAGGRDKIGLERVAINLDDARIADNAGRQPIDEPIVAGGPAAYFSSLPLKACVQALTQADLPAEVSNTAGTYVCNHVFYSLMHALAEHSAQDSASTEVRAGFVHLPWLPQQGSPSLSLDEMVQALRIIALTALSTPVDIKQVGGKIS
jgi:pyroglutamyl-peptidase